MKRVIIIGATSGIGRQLAVEMHQRGYTIGITGRRIKRLQALAKDLKKRVHIQRMDVSEVETAQHQLQSLTDAMGGCDILVLNAAVGNSDYELNWPDEKTVIDINVSGFVGLAVAGYNYFEQQGHGHLVGISSIAALFGYGKSAAYTASKAFISNYMQGLRQRASRSFADITISDIKPGFVESEMIKNPESTFWLEKTDVACRQIADAIEKRRNRAYITRRWRLIAWLIKLLPDFVLDRL